MNGHYWPYNWTSISQHTNEPVRCHRQIPWQTARNYSNGRCPATVATSSVWSTFSRSPPLPLGDSCGSEAHLVQQVPAPLAKLTPIGREANKKLKFADHVYTYRANLKRYKSVEKFVFHVLNRWSDKLNPMAFFETRRSISLFHKTVQIKYTSLRV